MKRVIPPVMYESPTPPKDIKALWIKRDNKTNEVIAVAKFIKGKWEPFLVSINYLNNGNEG